MKRSPLIILWVLVPFCGLMGCGVASSAEPRSSTLSSEATSVASASSSSVAPFTLLYPQQGKMDLVDSDVQEYWESSLNPESTSANPDHSYALAASANSRYCDKPTAYISFKAPAETYSIRLSPHEDFSRSFDVPCFFYNGSYTANLKTLYPQTTYYAQVFSSKGSSPSGVFSFLTSNSPRFLDSDGDSPRNFRDSGGYSTSSGKRIRYGMLYRGTAFDDLSPASRLVLGKELGIHSEIDLRNEGEGDFPSMVNLIDMKEPYYRCTLSLYESNFGSAVYESGIRSLFSILSSKSNYPLVLHCTHGADRTGVALFLIEGLCGVSYADLIRDYEMTSFYSYAQMRDASWSSGSIKGFYQGVMARGDSGDSLMTATRKYLVSIGVTAEEIQSVRSLLVESTASPIVNEEYGTIASLKAPCHVSAQGGTLDHEWVEEGDEVTANYTEVAGKSFSGWFSSDGKTLLSQDKRYVFTVEKHTAIQAVSI
jgi:protein tyrosine/serine phosphatase